MRNDARTGVLAYGWPTAAATGLGKIISLVSRAMSAHKFSMPDLLLITLLDLPQRAPADRL